MTRQNIVDLYVKEREYEESVFGNYSKNRSLNLASFLTFLETYVNKAKKSYTDKWSVDKPDWLISCIEEEIQGSIPIQTYEILIKIMALAGAALESYVDIDIDEWRKEKKPKEKWT